MQNLSCLIAVKMKFLMFSCYLIYFSLNSKSHLVSLLPAEADTVLDGEFVGGLTGTSQGGGVTTVSEAPQVSRHCRESR